MLPTNFNPSFNQDNYLHIAKTGIGGPSQTPVDNVNYHIRSNLHAQLKAVEIGEISVKVRTLLRVLNRKCLCQFGLPHSLKDTSLKDILWIHLLNSEDCIALSDQLYELLVVACPESIKECMTARDVYALYKKYLSDHISRVKHILEAYATQLEAVFESPESIEKNRAISELKLLLRRYRLELNVWRLESDDYNSIF